MIDGNLLVTICAYAVSLGAVYGGISTRIKQLEKKVDKHNHLVERMYKVENRVKILEKEKDVA